MKEEIRSAKLVNGNILLFFRNGLALLDQSLTIKERLEGLQNPASFDQRDGKIAFIELSLKNGKINSDFTLKTGEDKFTLSSVSETFLFTKILADRTILVSNAYIYSIVDNAIVDKVHLEKVTAVDSKDDKLALVDNKKLVIFDKDLKEIDRQDLGVDIGKISMRRNSIILIADNKLIVYENKNKIEANIENAVDYYENDAAFYTIFKDKIERVNAD